MQLKIGLSPRLNARLPGNGQLLVNTAVFGLLRGISTSEHREHQEYEQREVERQAADLRRNDLAELDRASSGLLAEGRLQEAVESVRKGLRSHPLAAVLYLKLGLTQSRLQLHREAADTFETMVRRNLDDFLVHWQLAREYEALGDAEGGQQQRVIYLQRYDAALLSIVNR